MLFKFFLDILNVSTKNTWGIDSFPHFDFELSIFPEKNDIIVKGFLKLEFFISSLCDIFNIILEFKKWSLHELFKAEGFLLIRNVFFGNFNDFFPMSVSDGVFSKTFNQWKNFNHIINFLLKLFIGSPRFKDTWKLGAIFGELFNLLSHIANFFNDLCPLDIFPFSKSILNFGVEVVKFIEKFDLLFSLFKLWILLIWKTEKHFTTVVGVEFSISDEILFLEHLKSVKSNLWFDTWNTWTVFNEISSESGDIVNKEVNFLDQVFLELGLLSEEAVLDFSGLFNKVSPIFIDDRRGIHLISFLLFVLHVGAIL